MADANEASSSGSVKTTASKKDLLTQWRSLGEKVKEQTPKHFFKVVAREVANELYDGNRDNYIKLDKQPAGG